MMKKVRGVVGVLVVVGAVVWVVSVAGRENPLPSAPAESSSEPLVSLAEGLEVPWDLAFLPNGDIILTERPGRIRVVDARDGLLDNALLDLSQVAATGEAGLLGIALHPMFPDSPYIYVYYTYNGFGGLTNRVSRFPFKESDVGTEEVVLDGIPGGRIHDGGRIRFGPDGMLYVTTGDSGNSGLAQDVDSLAGKILRLTPDGNVPPDNPFDGSLVFSYGHRNPQGLAWDDSKQLWATEHGSNATDELNLIEAGRNYGWPIVRGDANAAGMEPPVLQSGTSTWAPSGMIYLDGSVFFAGLRGASLYEVSVEEEPVLKRHLAGDFGRLRTVAAGPDGELYILTSNRDGRGTFVAADDRLVKVGLGAL